MSLDNTMRRHTEKSTKHWFSIYQMLEKHMQERTEEQEGRQVSVAGLETQPCDIKKACQDINLGTNSVLIAWCE